MKISELSLNAGDQFAIACQMLIIGVAFQKDGRTWDVISGWGDYLGTLSTNMIGNVNRFMKQNGKKGQFDHPAYSHGRIHTVTFIEAGWDQVEALALLEADWPEQHIH